MTKFFYNKSIQDRIKRELIAWFDNDHQKSCLAITATCRQAIGEKSKRAFIDPIRMSRNLRHVLQQISHTLYGTNTSRTVRLNRVLPVQERSLEGRLHYHIWIEVPEEVDPSFLEYLFRYYWTRSHWGYNEIHVGHDAHERWMNYQLKHRTKEGSVSDAIDVANMMNSPSAPSSLLRLNSSKATILYLEWIEWMKIEKKLEV